MWVLLKSLLAQWASVKLVLKAFGRLGCTPPLAFVPNALGLPVLLLLAALAIPVLLVLVALGLPVLLIVVVGGALVILTMWIVGIGLAALKLAIPLVLLHRILRLMVGTARVDPHPGVASDAG